MLRFRFLGLSLVFILSTMSLAPQLAKAQDARVIADTVFTAESGKQVRLSDFRGKVALVYFWASWCPH